MKFSKLVFTIVMIASQHAFGQQYPINLGPTPIIAGMQCNCFGVPTIVMPIDDCAKSVLGQGIFLHPAFFNLPAEIQLFTYAHECAHQMANVLNDENAADCMAAKMGRTQGWLSPNGLNAFCASMQNNPGNWTHAPGPMRCQNVIMCYNN